MSLVNIPSQVTDEAAARRRLLNEFNLEIGGGLGKLAGKCWRIGLMGHGATEESVAAILTAIDGVIVSNDEEK